MSCFLGSRLEASPRLCPSCPLSPLGFFYLPLSCLVIGQSSLVYQPMRATYSHSIQEATPHHLFTQTPPTASLYLNHRPLILLSHPTIIRTKSKFFPRPIMTYVMCLLLIPLCSCLLEAPASRAFLQFFMYSKLVCTLSSWHPLALYLGCFE